MLIYECHYPNLTSSLPQASDHDLLHHLPPPSSSPGGREGEDDEEDKSFLLTLDGLEADLSLSSCGVLLLDGEHQAMATSPSLSLSPSCSLDEQQLSPHLPCCCFEEEGELLERGHMTMSSCWGGDKALSRLKTPRKARPPTRARPGEGQGQVNSDDGDSVEEEEGEGLSILEMRPEGEDEEEERSLCMADIFACIVEAEEEVDRPPLPAVPEPPITTSTQSCQGESDAGDAPPPPLPPQVNTTTAACRGGGDGGLQSSWLMSSCPSVSPSLDSTDKSTQTEDEDYYYHSCCRDGGGRGERGWTFTRPSISQKRPMKASRWAWNHHIP